MDYFGVSEPARNEMGETHQQTNAIIFGLGKNLLCIDDKLL